MHPATAGFLPWVLREQRQILTLHDENNSPTDCLPRHPSPHSKNVALALNHLKIKIFISFCGASSVSKPSIWLILPPQKCPACLPGFKGEELPSPTPLPKKQMSDPWRHVEVLSEFFSGTLLRGQRARALRVTVCRVKQQSISLQRNVKGTGFSCLCVGREPSVCCHLTWNQRTPVPTSCQRNLCHRHMSHPPDLHSRLCLPDSRDKQC